MLGKVIEIDIQKNDQIRTFSQDCGRGIDVVAHIFYLSGYIGGVNGCGYRHNHMSLYIGGRPEAHVDVVVGPVVVPMAVKDARRAGVAPVARREGR